jgi:hypothetical protein
MEDLQTLLRCGVQIPAILHRVRDRHPQPCVALRNWNGSRGVDAQKVLPFGTLAEVREQVLRGCEIIKPGGARIQHQSQGQAATPVENIVALFDAAKKFNGRK